MLSNTNKTIIGILIMGTIIVTLIVFIHSFDYTEHFDTFSGVATKLYSINDYTMGMTGEGLPPIGSTIAFPDLTSDTLTVRSYDKDKKSVTMDYTRGGTIRGSSYTNVRWERIMPYSYSSPYRNYSNYNDYYDRYNRYRSKYNKYGVYNRYNRYDNMLNPLSTYRKYWFWPNSWFLY